MRTYVIHPVELATFHDVEFSFLVQGRNFGTRFAAPSLGFIIVDSDPAVLGSVVVDTGPRDPSEGLPPNERLEHYAEPAFAAKLAQLGRGFADVEHVILTHLHWDHVQNVDLFPNARIHLQRRELETAAAPVFPGYYNRKDVARFVDEFAPRTTLLDGDEEILPGIGTVLVGGHTFGSQMVTVKTAAGRAVITGDILNLYANLEHYSQKEVEPVRWAQAVKWLRRNADVMLAAHDPEVIRRYPVVGGDDAAGRRTS